MKFRNDIPEGITRMDLEEWIEKIENETLKVKLPEDYRNYMLAHNGGPAIGENVIFDADSANIAVGEDIILRSFHYLEDGQGTLEKEARRGGVNHIQKGLTICSTYSGILMLSLASNEFGSIYHMHGYGKPIKLANSWTEFVSYLIDAPEE
jgi:hypothetical protein